MSKGRTLRKRRAGAVATAAAVVVGSVMGGNAVYADTVDTDAESASHGHGLYVEGLGLDVAGSAYTQSEFPGDAGPNSDALNLTVLEGLVDVQLGDVDLPLITPDVDGNGLFYLGGLGAVSSRSESSSLTNSTASSGIINEDGSLNVDESAGEGFAPAELNLSALLQQVLGDEAVETLLDNATIQIGALGSTATKDGADVTSEYAVADLQVDASSPLVGGLVDTVDGTLVTVFQPIQDLLGPDGSIEDLVSTVVDGIGALPLVNAEVNELSVDTSSLITEVRDELLNEPLENAEGSVSLNLEDGTIGIDLAEIVMDAYGVSSLNDLDPNTEVLSGDVVNSILDGVTDALTGAGPNSLISKVVDIVTTGLYDAEVVVDIQADISLPIVGPLVDAPVTVTGTIGGFLGEEGYEEPVIDTSEIDVAGIPAGTVLQPIIDLLTGLVADIGGALEPVVDGVIDDLQPTLTGVVEPLVTSLLDDALEPLLTEVAQIRINEQPTAEPFNEPGGDLGDGSFTVRALSVNVLPNIAGVAVELGSSTVKAAEAAFTPVLEASSPVAAGEDSSLTSSGWPADTEVTVQLEDAEGNPVGDPITVTTDADGEFPADTVLTVPAGTTPGDYTVVATDADGNTAEDTITVEAAGDADVNANASASAAASANADDDSNASAQAAAQAAAQADATTAASAAADADATAAAESAATADASTAATADVDVDANANAAVAAQAAAQADASDDTNADASAAANANASAAASAASTADSSNDASTNAAADVDADATATADADADADPSADVNANASASAAASANADDDSNASAQAAAQAAAQADATTAASASADADATAAAESAATADASTAATADVDVDANANAAVAAQAAAQADASDDTNADASAAANANASAAASAASTADSSNDASTNAAADVDADATATATATATADADADADPSADVNANASASAAASANADDDSNASAQAAAQAAAQADATTAASAAADADATAAAESAATADASTAATADVDVDANVNAAAAAQAAANADNSSDANADSTASANANASAAASAASTADSSTDASSDAAADSSATATATATASAEADANGDADADAGELGINVVNPVLERGDKQTAVGTGFESGEVVTGVMGSDPLALGTQVANEAGTVTFTWTIPAGTNLGTHTVTLTGADSGAVAGTFEVVADGLATTGGDSTVGWIGLGALLIMLGLGTALVARRRHVQAHTE